MTKIKTLTVKQYINKRSEISYGKQIRCLDSITHASRGSWADNQNAIVKGVKITEKYLFILL